MNQAVFRSNLTKIIILSVLALAAATAYMLTDVNFANEKLFLYAMKIRTPKLIVMILTAFAIGGASIVFQSVAPLALAGIAGDELPVYLNSYCCRLFRRV